MGPENIFKDHEEREKWLMRSKNFESHLLWTLISKQQRADFAPLK